MPSFSACNGWDQRLLSWVCVDCPPTPACRSLPGPEGGINPHPLFISNAPPPPFPAFLSEFFHRETPAVTSCYIKCAGHYPSQAGIDHTEIICTPAPAFRIRVFMESQAGGFSAPPPSDGDTGNRQPNCPYELLDPSRLYATSSPPISWRLGTHDSHEKAGHPYTTMCLGA